MAAMNSSANKNAATQPYHANRPQRSARRRRRAVAAWSPCHLSGSTPGGG